MPEGRWPRGVTPRQRSGAAAESARLRQCMNGREELPYIGSQGRQPGGATPPPRSCGCTQKSLVPDMFKNLDLFGL